MTDHAHQLPYPAIGLPRPRGTPSRLSAARAVFSGPPPTSALEAYERAAPVYPALHWCWLRMAGGSAERELVRFVRGTLRDGLQVLDAGTGTGRLVRRLQRRGPRPELTLLDLSPAMLARAHRVEGRRVVAPVSAMPFADGTFDLVISAWVLETLCDPEGALRECARVLAPGGHLVYCFSSLPSRPLTRRASSATRRVVARRFAGSFLREDPSTPPGCRRLHRFQAAGQLATTVVVEKHGLGVFG